LPDLAAHAAEMLGSADAIREAIMTFSDIGADEVMLYCWSDRRAGQVPGWLMRRCEPQPSGSHEGEGWQ
jgi:phosphoenolpyruvate carboxylase